MRGRAVLGALSVTWTLLHCGSFGAVPDTPQPAEDATASDTASPAVEPPPDASTRIVVSRNWRSPNGAIFRKVDGGAVITGYTSSAHPIIVPDPQPSLLSEKFTVRASVLAPHRCEFGLLVRMQPDHSSVVLGSIFGGESRPYLGLLPSDGGNGVSYEPTREISGLEYAFEEGARYLIKIRVDGAIVSGKFWKDWETEPLGWMGAELTIPWSTGHGVGFYVYPIAPHDAVIENIEITLD